LIDRGFVGTVCTPHIISDQFPKNTPDRISGWVADLQEKLIAEGLEYQLWTGGEVRIAPGILQWFDKIGVPTLGPSQYVLTDWWESAWPDYGYRLFEDLLEAGYQPILAHPERMCLDERDLFKLIDAVKELGVWLQGNFNSLGGGEGPQAADWARHWLANGAYDLVATDMHRPEMLSGRFRGIDEAHRILGAQGLRELLETRPRAIMGSPEPDSLTEDQASAA
jgi:protein-tyrosine phosphatase